jgi:hypothetical protein
MKTAALLAAAALLALAARPAAAQAGAAEGAAAVKTADLLASWPVRLGVGLGAGAVNAFVDNVASGGEVSPVVTAALLFAESAAAGALWGKEGWLAAVAAWAPLPLAHLVKRVLGLPDTLQPNSYRSILYLAGFTLAVSAGGFSVGLLFRAASPPAGP